MGTFISIKYLYILIADFLTTTATLYVKTGLDKIIIANCLKGKYPHRERRHISKLFFSYPNIYQSVNHIHHI